MLKVNDKIEYTAAYYSNAETVGEFDGYTVFVPFMLVGERALVKINYVKRNVAYADVVKILEPSPNRIHPVCTHFGRCGGCSLMNMRYEEQLNFKRNKVKQNLVKIGKLNCGVLPCVPSYKQLGYRNKLSLPVAGKKGNAVIGMYRRGTHSVVECRDCLLGGQWSATLVNLFADYLNAEGISPYNETDFSGEVRHLVARYIDGQLLVTVVSNGEFKHSLQPLADRLKFCFDKFGLFVNVNTCKNNVIMGKKTTHVCGIRYIQSEHLGVKFRLQPNSFFQVNDGVKDAIYLKVQQLLDLSKTEALVDCFSGVGVLTNVLANGKFDTYAVEIEPSAVRDAQDLAELNSKNITNICGDVNTELPRLMEKLADKRVTMVVDPPRKGLGEKVCNTILNTNVDNIVYISCDSATLARDLAMLTAKYNVTYAEPYDLFPQTDQVETVVLLTCTENKDQ